MIVGLFIMGIIGLLFNGLIYLLIYLVSYIISRIDDRKYHLKYLYSLLGPGYSLYASDYDVEKYFKEHPTELKKAKLLATKIKVEKELAEIEKERLEKLAAYRASIQHKKDVSNPNTNECQERLNDE